jgi:membrane associated rhomboid family serine protease
MLVGIAGNFSSTVFEDRCEVVVGASGCIFGLLGLYLSDIVLNFESLSLPWLRLGTLVVALTFLITSEVLLLMQNMATFLQTFTCFSDVDSEHDILLQF